MTLRFDADVINDAIDASVANVDEGAAEPNGVVEFWSGSPPGSLGGTPAGDLLAIVDFEDPAFGAAAVGSAAANGVPIATTGVDDGTIGFIRVLDRDQTPRWDDDSVGTSGTNVIVNTLTVSIGVDFNLESYLFTAASASP